MRLRDEEHAETPGAPRGHFGAAAVGEHRTARREGERRHLHPPAVVFDGLARPQPAQELDTRFHDVPAPAAVDAEHVELLVAVSDADDVRHASAAHEVDDREVLGELHRFVQREQQRGHVDRHGRRARRRSRPPSGPVTAGSRRADAWCSERTVARHALALGPRRHVERGAVHRGPGLRLGEDRPHAESHHEHRVSFPHRGGGHETGRRSSRVLARFPGRAAGASRIVELASESRSFPTQECIHATFLETSSRAAHGRCGLRRRRSRRRGAGRCGHEPRPRLATTAASAGGSAPFVGTRGDGHAARPGNNRPRAE